MSPTSGSILDFGTGLGVCSDGLRAGNLLGPLPKECDVPRAICGLEGLAEHLPLLPR